MRTSITALLLSFACLCGGLRSGAQAGKSFSTRPFILGETTDLQSAILKEKRTLNIYLPEGYNAADTVRYPVVYLLDGAADEDFIHVAGICQYNNFPWVARAPKAILVGIANTDRRRDFTFPTTVAADKKQFPTTGGSAAFVRFIGEELQPFIEAHYKTAVSKTIIGQSLGGLLATEILLKKPMLFDHYIIISPSLWWDGGSLLKWPAEALRVGFSRQTSVYIGVGKEGLTPGDPPRVMEVDANMLADKLKTLKPEALKVYFDYLPGEDHATVGHQAVMNALKMMYPPAAK